MEAINRLSVNSLRDISSLFHAFIERKPWASAVFAFILGPAIGMFYLGKGRKGLLYLAIEYAVIALPVFSGYFGAVSPDLDVLRGLWAIMLRIVGVPHCYFVAKRRDDPRPQVWFARWYGIVTILLLPLLLALMVRTLLFQPFHIPASSMSPTVNVGDHLFVSKTSYGYSRYSFPGSPPIFEGRIFAAQPERGDIVVFRLPTDGKTDYIKRIVGLPGDRIQMIDGILHINGTPVEREKIRERDGSDLGAAEYRETLPNGINHLIREYGDTGHSDNTSEYKVPEGHFFVLGDNRDNSTDSRFLKQVGYVPFENLIGKVAYIFWNSEDREFKF